MRTCLNELSGRVIEEGCWHEAVLPEAHESVQAYTGSTDMETFTQTKEQITYFSYFNDVNNLSKF